MSDSATEKIMGMEPEKGRWVLVFLGLIINLCLGTIYSWSVFVAPLTAYFTKTLGQTVTAGDVLLPFSVFLAFFAIAMPFTGKYIEQYGPRNVTIVGGIMTGLGWLLASFATSVPMLYIVYGVIGGIGVGIAYGVPVAVAARWFPDRRGLAVGLTVLGFGFSAFFTANIAGLAHHHVRGHDHVQDLRGCIRHPDHPAGPAPQVPESRLDTPGMDCPCTGCRAGCHV